jgi:addiction module HigA family antidote
MIQIQGVDSRMIANNLTPYEPTHPGEVLKDEIEYRGISQRKLAKQMDISYSLLNEVLNCKRPVLAEYALLFEAALGIEAEMLIKMQARYNLQAIRQDKSWNERLAKIRKAAVLLLHPPSLL